MPEDKLTEVALAIATEAHKGQNRKWSSDPYIVHPVRVAAMVRGSPAATPVDVAAALLHDVVEDTPVKAPELTDRLTGAGIPSPVAEEVVALVLELTQDYGPDEEKGMSRAQKRERDWLKLAKVSDRAKRIKLCDRIDNIGASPMPSGMLRKYLPESRELLRICGPADPDLADRLLTLIETREKEVKR